MDWLLAGATVGLLLVVAGASLYFGYHLGHRLGYEDGYDVGYAHCEQEQEGKCYQGGHLRCLLDGLW